MKLVTYLLAASAPSLLDEQLNRFGGKEKTQQKSFPCVYASLPQAQLLRLHDRKMNKNAFAM